MRETDSSSDYRIELSAACSGWPTPNLNVESMSDDSQKWMSIQTGVLSQTKEFHNRTEKYLGDGGLHIVKYTANFTYSLSVREYKLLFFCWNEHGNTSSELILLGLLASFQFLDRQ